MNSTLVISQYTENFTTKKLKFSDENSVIFHIYVKNIDCGYPLERVPTIYVFEKRKIMYTPCKPQFYYIKVGFKGVKII